MEDVTAKAGLVGDGMIRRRWVRNGKTHGVERIGSQGHDWLVRLAFFCDGTQVPFPDDFAARCLAREPGYHVVGFDPEETLTELD